MAFTKISLTNGKELKIVPLGFSWTMLFFGGWVPIIRQDWIWGICLLLASIFTYGIAGIVCAFFYNKNYALRLLRQGFYVHYIPGDITEEKVRDNLGLMKVPFTKGE